MKVIVSSFVNNANVRGAVKGLLHEQLLSKFYVPVAAFKGGLLDRLGSINLFAEIKRRNFDTSLKPFIKTWPWFELARHLVSKTGFSILTKKEDAPLFLDTVCQNLDKRVASQLRSSNRRESAVYCYEDCASLSFKEAKRKGIKSFYDLPIGYWRAGHRLLNIERERLPEWAPTLTSFNDSASKLARKDEELSLANHIFVASNFTANTLKEYPGALAPVTVIPYGFPPIGAIRDYPSRAGLQPLKLLFVGSLSQRKGIADLFMAIKAIKHRVALTVVGLKVNEDCNILNVELAKHRWIPTLPHSEIIKLMREHDVLVFPSLFEGFGLVITEAMSQGTPVITTERTAGPDIINHNENGWLIEAGSKDALQHAIEELLDNPKTIARVGREAMETARLRPWEIYGYELAMEIKKLL